MNTLDNNELIGIIHLTDIHFLDETDVLLQKKVLLFRALKDDFFSCQSIYIVVSGDIAAKGKFHEYEVARQFFNFIFTQLKNQYPSMTIKFVFVPGNHDCNFDLDTQIRRNIIKDITYESIGEDGSVFDECLKVQQNFWNFYYYFNQFNIPNDRIYYHVIDYIAGKTVCFHCFNTAWMSQKDEKVGTLFFPVKHYADFVTNNHFDLNITVLHHPLNWFNPNAADNNKREFQNLLEITSSMEIIGHEHENEVRQSENMDSLFSKKLSFSGEVLQDLKNHDRSGFQTFLIDLNTNMVKQRRYNFGDDIYKLSSEAEFNLDKKRKRFLTPRESFIQKINEINIPLNFNGNSIKLSDIFVFPDVEKVTSQPEENMEDYIDSQHFIDKNDYKRCLFEGDSQIGKSSFLYLVFQRFWEKGYYPILVNGNDITSNNIDKLLSNVFKSQYSDDQLDYEKFRQLEKAQKILLIDDLHTVKLNKNLINQLLKNLFSLFERVFITIDTAYNLLPQIQTNYNDVCSFIIKPLGYLKSNELLEKYLKFTDHWTTLSEQDALEKTRNIFNQLREVLGNKLLPSYPIFVLSIVQALEYKPFKLNETSCGYCYQSLIHIALSRAGISKDDFDAYMNILTEFAYWLFRSNYEIINDKEFGAFFLDYQTKFIAPGSFDTIKNKLVISKIIKEEAGCYYFIYKYLFYFLVAKKIAKMLEQTEGKSIISRLFNNLHEEKNANILVFITHHTDNLDFIQDSILSTMVPFENTVPITLKKQDDYYKLLEEIVQNITQGVIENRDPIEERKIQLSTHDQLQLKYKHHNNQTNNFSINEKTVPFIYALRSIEILGQILKNRKGSLEKTILQDMLIELYNTSFRMIGYIGEMIKETKNELSNKIMEEKISVQDTNEDIKEIVYKFLQFISLQACLGVFSKLIYSIGVKELREVYSEVAATIDTPAAKIISFSINSYYGKIDMRELINLAEEFKGNIVALQILRARVKSYVYNNYVDYKSKQRIATYLGMKISPMMGLKEKGY